MWKLIVRLVVNAVAIWAAAYLVSGVSLDTSNVFGVLAVAIVFGLVNALLKPALKWLGFPLLVLTLGLFALVINAGLLGLTAWVTDALQVEGFWPALWGSVVVSVVSWALGIFVSDDDDD